MNDGIKLMLKDLTGYLSSTKLGGVPSWQLVVAAGLIFLLLIKLFWTIRSRKTSKHSSRGEGGFYREFKERLQYHVDNLFARGASAQFGLLLFATVVVTLIGMSAALFGLFSPENKGVASINHDSTTLWDSFWWSAKHIFDSGQVIGMYGSTLPVLLTSLFMSLASMVIFGLLISFISGMLSQRIEQLKSGSSTVKEHGHILILGWNSKVIPMIQELAIGKPHMKVVIFAPLPVDTMREHLRAGGFLQSKIKVILRSGTPNNIGELKRVAFDKAYSIVCLAPDSEDGKIAQNDIEVIKTLMLINSFKDWAGGTRPKIVSEITQNQNVHIANVAGGHRSPIVSSGAIVSRLVVQSSRQRGIATVYSEMFSYNGSEIYIRPFPQCTGLNFGDILGAFSNAIPLGVSVAKKDERGIMRYLPTLNPPKDHKISKDEWLIMLAADSSTTCNPTRKIPPPVHLGTGRYTRTTLENVLIIGWNSSIYGTLSEFDDYLREGTTIDVIANYSEEEVALMMKEALRKPFKNIKVNYAKVNALAPGMLSTMNILERDCVIILADESSGDTDPDGRTIMTLLLLREACGEDAYYQQKGPQLVAEIILAKNREAVASAQANEVIVSPEIVAMILTQISQQQMLSSIYDDLLTAGGMEIYIKPASRYVTPGVNVTFGQLIAAAYEFGEIALGVRIDAQQYDVTRNFGVQLNMDKDTVLNFSEGDRVVALAESLYD